MSIELDVEELEEIKEQAFLEGVIGTLVRVKALLMKEGDPKEVLGRAIREIVEIGTTAASIEPFKQRTLNPPFSFEW